MKNSYSLEYFLKKNWSLILIKDGKISYKSKMRRLRPLIFCIKKFGKVMRGAVVFDRNVGQASAMLLKFAGVKEVWTPTASIAGKKFLAKNKIKLSYGNLVKSINQESGEICPMEKMSSEMGENNFVKKMLN
jgi:hypothetical protein